MGDPELRGLSTGSMVTNFRRSFGTALRAGLRLHFTQILFENVTQEKINLAAAVNLAAAAVRLRRPLPT